MPESRVCLIGGSGFIGFHLHEFLLKMNVNHVIFDKKEPGGHFGSVISEVGDLESREDVSAFFSRWSFSTIINLAAKTDDRSDLLDDYSTNFLGVATLLEVLENLHYQGNFFQISSQYVAGPTSEYNSNPLPVNTYGESKLLAEEIVKKSSIPNWAILRPTNVWGTHHPGFPYGFWRIIRSGFYMHPRKKVVRSYVFVTSLCDQIYQFINLNPEKYHGRSFYVSDEPIDSYLWVNHFSLGITGKKVRRVPVDILRLISLVGFLLSKLNISFPLTPKRFRSMTTDYVIDLSETWQLISKPHVDLEIEILKTSNWYLDNFNDRTRVLN